MDGYTQQEGQVRFCAWRKLGLAPSRETAYTFLYRKGEDASLPHNLGGEILTFEDKEQAHQLIDRFGIEPIGGVFPVTLAHFSLQGGKFPVYAFNGTTNATSFQQVTLIDQRGYSANTLGEPGKPDTLWERLGAEVPVPVPLFTVTKNGELLRHKDHWQAMLFKEENLATLARDLYGSGDVASVVAAQHLVPYARKTLFTAFAPSRGDSSLYQEVHVVEDSTDPWLEFIEL